MPEAIGFGGIGLRTQTEAFEVLAEGAVLPVPQGYEFFVAEFFLRAAPWLN